MNESEKKTVKRNLFTSALCLALLLIMLLSSTLAWFTDSKHNVNTMVAGKISIEQKEYSDTNHTTEFENNKFVMMPSQTVVKEVVVTNTGNQPCYVRTLFAFEDSEATKVVEKLTITGKDGQIVIPGVTDTTVAKIQFTYNGTLYTVGYCIYNGQLAENGTFVPLVSVGLAEDTGNDWTDAVAGKYELLVLSQACQVAGLDNLGENGAESPAAALDKAFYAVDAAHCKTWFTSILNG